MKTKDAFIGILLWVIVVFAFYIGEKMGRESVEAKPITKTDTLYIRKERICERDCYTGAVECQEFVQPVRSAE